MENLINQFKCAYCDKPIQTTNTSEGFFVALEECECQTKY